MKKLLQSLFILLFIAVTAIAQDRTVTGTVTAKEDGMALPGVSVKVKGTNIGTQTGVDGKFSLKLSGSGTLVFTYIGYTSREVQVGNNSSLNVVLTSDTRQLGEVVVVAYGTAKKEAITGSVATLGAKEIENRVVTNISNVFAGLAPGIQSTSGNGQPGSGASIRVRGFGSYSASNAPLYVLDGAVYDGSIGDINPNDIESVSLLKDASSTALYGARAGNGVVIITTKKGKLGEPKFNVSLNSGFSARSVPEYDRMNAYEYYPAMWRALYNTNRYVSGQAEATAAAGASSVVGSSTGLVYNPFNVASGAIVLPTGQINPGAVLRYNDFDWMSYLDRVGKRNDFNANLSGNTGKSDYFLSMGYVDDQGWIMNSDFKRFSARVNVNAQVKKWLKTGFNIAGNLSKSNNASDAASGNASSFINPILFTRRMGPIYPVRAYDANGNPVIDVTTGKQFFDYGLHPGSVNRPSGASPGRHVVYETMLNTNQSERNAINARGYADIKFLKDFTFKTSISTDLRSSLGSVNWSNVVGDGVTYGGYASRSNSFIRSYTFNQILTYDKTINKHNFNALMAHENYDLQLRANSSSKQLVTAIGNPELGNYVTPRSADGTSDYYRIESYFSKASYNYDDKYFIDASVRRDASSRFAEESRWGTFFSAGASWVISKENFMSNVNWVNNLKLKASYGEVGNDDLGSYYAYQAFYDLGWNNGAEPGILLSSVATPELKWETSKTFNTGLSFALFNNRVTGELEYFKRGSSNLLFNVPTGLSFPVTTISQNVGSMYNEGVELQLGVDVVRTKNFTWNVLNNVSAFKNRITKMPTENPVITSGTKRREVGKDLYAFWLRQWAGVDPFDGSALYELDPTLTTSATRTIDGKTYTTDPNFARFAYSGTAIPDFYGSMTNTFNYKDFSFSFLVNYQVGGKFYDAEYATLMSVSLGRAMHKDNLNAWTTLNQLTSIPRIDNSRSNFFNAASSRWLVDASYLSISNANISYKLPKSILSKLDVANARVFVAGENLRLFTKRKGMNPTESYDGVGSTTYLPSRAISFGLNVTL